MLNEINYERWPETKLSQSLKTGTKSNKFCENSLLNTDALYISHPKLEERMT